MKKDLLLLHDTNLEFFFSLQNIVITYVSLKTTEIERI